MVEDPIASELTQEVERILKGFDAGTRQALRLSLKYGELTEQAARGLVMQSGNATNQTMYFIPFRHYSSSRIRFAGASSTAILQLRA